MFFSFSHFCVVCNQFTQEYSLADYLYKAVISYCMSRRWLVCEYYDVSHRSEAMVFKEIQSNDICENARQSTA